MISARTISGPRTSICSRSRTRAKVRLKSNWESRRASVPSAKSPRLTAKSSNKARFHRANECWWLPNESVNISVKWVMKTENEKFRQSPFPSSRQTLIGASLNWKWSVRSTAHFI